ncbi:serine hydrolase domain-containing protein [Pseudofulvimonas gallinarii]|uniref:CubicO group peptidase (Beta-lactamase class C family) n=1 Tax=Pseudofulvimonas gallinarii TaxID=634155 RepID=A0A4R3L2K9_9GAMM|nr:serine hydrolase domain-containing protein [Pseudofulvimonas gallinarii]TCS93699.1 CubicO group peptidase (beta-lactamase class C family) [Pseudofulvimonas gallinarii]
MRRTFHFLPTLPALLLATAVSADTPPSPRTVAAEATRLLEQHVPADGPGMAVLVARGDEILYRGARGKASIELGVPLSPDHVFRIGSVTKQFAAAGLLKLVDEGKVALDDPLSRFLPDYPNGDAITVAQLLNHTSGIQSYTSIPSYMDQDIRRDVDTDALIAVFKDKPAPFAPGSDWDYNNSGYVLVGAVIEKASGKGWSAYLDEVLFKPLSLDHTRDGAGLAIVAGHASGYSTGSDGFSRATPISMTQPHAAGALLSTVDDLWRWNRALHGGKVLSADSYMRMTTPEGKAAENGRNYGYGIFRTTVRNRTAFEHGGGINGFLSDLFYLPDSGVSVAVLRNADGEGGATVGLIARKLAAVAIGDPYPEQVAVAMAPAELKALEGVYRKDADNARVLRMRDGALTSQRSGGPVFTLVPLGNDRFGFGDGSLSLLEIDRDASGAPTGLRLISGGEGEGELWTRSQEALPDAPVTVELPREALDRVVGQYEAEGISWRVFFDDAGMLRVQVPGQPAFALLPMSPTLFRIAEVDARFEFGPETGDVQTCRLEQGAVRIEARRKPD